MPKEQIVQQPATVLSQGHFSQVPAAEVERSKFDRSHGLKATWEDAGNLYPIYVDEVLPGDTHSIQTTLFVRLATPLVPFFDNLKVDIHFFYVPNRLVFPEWANFLGERKTPTDKPENYTIPTQTFDLAVGVEGGYLADYLQLPLSDAARNTTVNVMPFRAYGLIWQEWYRDQNIEGNIDIFTVDWSQTPIYKRNKTKDYFTSALPWPQKGDPVTIPLGTEADIFIQAFGGGAPATGTSNSTLLYEDEAGSLEYYQNADLANSGVLYTTGGSSAPGTVGDNELKVDLTTATAVSINDLRTSFQIQRLLERDARGGTRLQEIVLNHFGVLGDDARLQRPEFLGSGHGYININPVASTVATVDAPQGQLAATGTGIIKSSIKHSFTEHGYIMGIASVKADLNYQLGLDKMWTRKTRYDFYWPALSHLGEQAILTKEISFRNELIQDDVWGYQERYGEYRWKTGKVVGKMRSVDPNSLDYWHLAEDFGTTTPNLNTWFVNESPPIDRVVAVTTEPKFLVDGWFNVQSERPMPVYAVPGYVDHF